MSYVKLKSEYNDLDKHNIDGHIFYCKKDTYIYHNPYGVAYICKNTYKEYWINDKRHRLDGPAKIWRNGLEEYWINNKFLTKEEFEIHPERLKFLGKEYLICLK